MSLINPGELAEVLAGLSHANAATVIAALVRLRALLNARGPQGQAQVASDAPVRTAALACLAHADERVRAPAAMAVCALVARNQEVAGQVAAMPHVLDALVAGVDTPATAAECLWALSALAGHVTALLPRAIALLTGPSAEVASAAAWFLHCCAIGSASLCVEAGAFPALMLVANDRSPPAVRELAMRALATLIALVPALAADPTVATCVSMLCDVICRQDKLAAMAMWLLGTLAMADARVQRQVGSWADGAVFAALIVDTDSVDARASAAGCMVHLSAGCPDNSAALVRTGALEVCVAWLSAPGVTVRSAQVSLTCLLSLCLKQAEHQLRLASVPEFVGRLCNLLGCRSSEVRGTAAALLGVLATCQPTLQAALAAAVPKLVTLLAADADVFVQQQAMAALYRLCIACPANTSALLAGGGSAGVCAALITGRVNTATYTYAMLLLRWLCTDADVAAAVAGTEGLLPALMRLGRACESLGQQVDALLPLLGVDASEL